MLHTPRAIGTDLKISIDHNIGKVGSALNDDCGVGGTGIVRVTAL